MVVTSSPSMMMWPEDGSMMRLIILRLVVLPQPDGPTKTTISPLGIFRLRRSTAGDSCPGKRLVSSWSSIIVSPRCASSPRRAWGWSALVTSLTDTSRDGQTADGEVEQVEQHRQNDDEEGAAEQRLE